MYTDELLHHVAYWHELLHACWQQQSWLIVQQFWWMLAGTLSILFTVEGYNPPFLPGTWFVQILWLTCPRNLRSTAAAWKKDASPAWTPERTPSSDPCTGPALRHPFLCLHTWVWVHPWRSSPKLDTLFKHYSITRAPCSSGDVFILLLRYCWYEWC